MKIYTNKKIAVVLIILVSIVSLGSFILCKNNSITKGKKVNSIEIIRESDEKTWTLSDKDQITKFIKVLDNNKEINAKIDIRPKDYSVKVYYNDKSTEEYMMWIGKDDNMQGILMNRNKAWYINQESNIMLKEILK